MKLIGVTGLLGSGKTTLCKKIIENYPEIKYVNVDDIRAELSENTFFLREISELSNRIIIDRKSLNEAIYSDPFCMSFYKSVLYQKLFNDLKSFNNNDIILVEWALIIQDKLFDKFDKLIIINKDINTILENFSYSDLPKDEIIRRIKIQEEQFKDFNNLNISYIIYKNFEDTIKFIKEE